jgi:hypothetical protein
VNDDRPWPLPSFAAARWLLAAGWAALTSACAAADPEAGVGGAQTAGVSSTAGSGGALGVGVGGAGPGCPFRCALDFHSVVDCEGRTVETCEGQSGCSIGTATCVNACLATIENGQSVGCEYFATYMDQIEPNGCFAAFVANTWNTPAHITVDWGGAELPVEAFARIPTGSGAALAYEPFDAAAGIAPGEVVVLFLSGPKGDAGLGCPVSSAITSDVMLYGQTGIGRSFRIASDVPVVAYQINPYGGGTAQVTGASLLLPTSVWDDNYIAVNAGVWNGFASPSMNIVAAQDHTEVTMVPVAPVEGGGGIPAGAINEPLTFTLDRGEHAQLTQPAALTGSVIQADKPIGLMAGHHCMNIPFGVPYCDHAEQMVPPVKALGNEYVGVQHRPRADEPGIWQVIGAVDGTALSWSSEVGGPAALERGQVSTFMTADPFVVRSQDDDHPFMLFAYMSGSKWTAQTDGRGDPDFVIGVPPKQYMPAYVFFADPTYPETNLVVVRAKLEGAFEDVVLDCAGALSGWQAIGDYEWTRVDLTTGNFEDVGGCSTGRHEIASEAPFGIWIWGWGTPQTSNEGGLYTRDVSYGYPGGMNARPINGVTVPPVPK